MNEEEGKIGTTYISMETFNKYRKKLQNMHRRAQKIESEYHHLLKDYNMIKYCQIGTNDKHFKTIDEFKKIVEGIKLCFKYSPKTISEFEEEEEKILNLAVYGREKK